MQRCYRITDPSFLPGAGTGHIVIVGRRVALIVLAQVPEGEELPGVDFEGDSDMNVCSRSEVEKGVEEVAKMLGEIK